MKKFMTHVFRPGTGRTVPSASIRVKEYPSVIGDPNTPVFSDEDGLLQIAQPFLANANGMVEFYAPDGRYDLYFTIPDPTFGTITYTWTDVNIDGTDTVTAIVSSVQNGHFVLTENDTAFPNRVQIPTFKGHPDTPPVVAGTLDNEFDGVVAGWGTYNGDGNTTASIANGRLRIRQVTTNIANPCVGYHKTFSNPAGDFSLTALLRLGYDPGVTGGEMGGERPMIGIGIRSNLGEISTVGIRAGSQGISVFQTDYSAASLVSSTPCQQIGSNACYVRIRRVASDLLYEWSQDGFTYVTVAKRTQASVFSGTFANAGLYILATFDTGGSVDCYADFIRQA